jgi:hypothetical protein
LGPPVFGPLPFGLLALFGPLEPPGVELPGWLPGPPGVEPPGLELPGVELPGVEPPGVELPGVEPPGVEPLNPDGALGRGPPPGDEVGPPGCCPPEV